MTTKIFRGSLVALRPSWVFQLFLGPGAGYTKGYTLFVSHNSGSLRWLKAFRNGKPVCFYRFWEYVRIGEFEFGFTRNWNVMPYVSH